MKTKKIILAAIALLVLSIAGYALYMMGMQRGTRESSAAGISNTSAPVDLSSIAAGEQATRRHIKDGLKAGDTDPMNGEKVLYYHDPMVPGKRFETPAKSPFMDMMLVPVYAGASGADSSNVTVSPRVQQNLGLRTAEVVQGTLSPQLQAIGSIAWNERDQSVVQARAAGFVERLYVRATLDAVRAGQPFADLYVPEWVAAQQEFLALKKAAGNDLPLITAARQRMLLAGMNDAQVARVESSGMAQQRVTITVPSSGVVAELVAREGMTVTPGMTLARINGLATVWALAEVPESQIALIRMGAKVEARSPGAPGTVFNGTVQAILPEVTAATRTLKARVQLANPGNALSPGMLVTMQFMDQRSAPALLVPTEAIIATGQRMVVMLAEEGGRYRPVNVETGIESGGQTEVKKGLTRGQRVVVSSQFLIDSEASLKGVEARLNNEPPPKPVMHQGEGRVDAMDKDAVTLTHGPIPSIGWGSMTMAFKPRPDGLPRNVAVGDRVQFEFVMPKDGEPTLTGISPILPSSTSAALRAGASK
ncbi:MAG: efflux RND transporter periplasmic adaptor subunit [Polaromonas sp.]|nr:efflux RND transporter periplasmic adaptor subunit [Polaromonas sp.]